MFRPVKDHSRLLASGFSAVIQTGYGNSNLVAVIARGGSFELYVNHQLITGVSDGTYSHGQVGIVSYNQGGLATAVYSNARVWTL